MSVSSSYTIRESYKKDYYSLRNDLRMNGLSIGDFLIYSYRENREKLTKRGLTKEMVAL